MYIYLTIKLSLINQSLILVISNNHHLFMYLVIIPFGKYLINLLWIYGKYFSLLAPYIIYWAS